MKKFISLVLSVLMIFTVIGATAVPCFAISYNSIHSADKEIKIDITVDGQDSIHGEYNHVNKDDSNGNHFPVIDFVYNGDKDILHWEVIDLEEGKDYIIVKQEDKLLQLEIINPTITDILVNVITRDEKYPGGEEVTQIKGDVVDVTTTEPTTTVKKPDKSLKSPNTGAGMLGASVAATGVGVALLGVARKRK